MVEEFFVDGADCGEVGGFDGGVGVCGGGEVGGWRGELRKWVGREDWEAWKGC